MIPSLAVQNEIILVLKFYLVFACFPSSFHLCSCSPFENLVEEYLVLEVSSCQLEIFEPGKGDE